MAFDTTKWFKKQYLIEADLLQDNKVEEVKDIFYPDSPEALSAATTKAREILDKHKEEKSLKYLVGEIVKIDTGPFATFTGTIESVKGDKVSLNVKVFGRNTPVELNVDQISKP